MAFFDLNVPYLEREGSALTAAQESAAAASKAARLKVVVKAMELGYSGVAYNRTIRGVVSDSDRCKIPPFHLCSLLGVAPALAAAARFHREILRVPLQSPFRQYTRLTVTVDSELGAAALSSGNSVLRSYHLVAVRPLNQTAFDQICKVSEVDLIAIDFSQKLPFRLKLPMVKAAIERGIYFEITYSHLISDVDVRRQMLTNAKNCFYTLGAIHLSVSVHKFQVLVDWTRGRNLIFSSGASNVNEVRGPYDVINLFSLLGLSMEKAKKAVSRNCSCLLNGALRRKQCYDEAIKIEKISSRTQVNSKDWFSDWSNWDPISSGDGDLPALDDIARIFSSSGDVSQVYIKVNDETAADGMLLDTISSKEEDPMSSDDRGVRLPITSEHESSGLGNEAPLQDRHHFPPSDLCTVSPRDENSEPAITENEDFNCSFNEMDDAYTEDWEPSLSNTPSSCNPVNRSNPLSPSDSVKFSSAPENVGISGVFSGKTLSLDGHEAISVVPSAPVDSTLSKDVIFGIQDEMPPNDQEKRTSNPSGTDRVSFLGKDPGSVIEPSGAQDVPEMKVLPRAGDLERKDPFMSVFDTLCEKEFPKCGTSGEAERISFPETDSSLFSSKDADSLRKLSSECDAPEGKALSRTEDLERKDPFMGVCDMLFQRDSAKSGTDGGTDCMSFPESISFIEVSKDMKVQGQRDTVSVVDSTPSRDILVNMHEENKASPTPIDCLNMAIKGKSSSCRPLEGFSSHQSTASVAYSSRGEPGIRRAPEDIL
ncbi:unnamed protein product [Spirodela intermedia]|uniref:Uncharacterized protein n=1 Tax=Spirodela intermedia TaxID=51605 RepID=A0A7I8IB94_SPIIN|nr:unnamed protein product [Spirodela intermedia]CAA6654848.1 unnamed protein product [Spirodela intermedia]